MTSDISVVKKLQNYPKSFFSVADLSKILNLSESEIYVTLTRLTQRGVLIRLTKGYYSVFGKSIDTDIIATQIYHPSYLSLETILARS
ncbi:MAG: type IV toxin-antitoxin system AbiEi family antitoxin domain-containing protein, partial [bacterium]|nr:type IV toxin-antitoxin system AbiEi family antitoxin domain-containing protein [bacterium]